MFDRSAKYLTKFLAKNPVPVRCPVAGKFNFTQHGEHPFKTRLVGIKF